MQYFRGDGPIGGRNVSQILTNVVRGLAADPKRRFSYVEQVRSARTRSRAPSSQRRREVSRVANRLTFIARRAFRILGFFSSVVRGTGG